MSQQSKRVSLPFIDNAIEKMVKKPSSAKIAATEGTPQGTEACSLREIEKSDRFFWKTDQNEQWSMSVFDKMTNGKKRPLAKNEIAVMALNEIAAANGQGFFFHLRNKEFWKKPPNSELHPSDRVAPQPGATYPDILFMRFVWDQSSRDAFDSSTHRARYLRSDGLINLPNDSTPLYAIQYAYGPKYPLYTTPVDSMVILSTQDNYYVSTTGELEDIVGRWPAHKPRPAFQDPEQRLDTTPYLWKDDDQLAGKKERWIPLQRSSLEEVYKCVIERCLPGQLASTFDVRTFKKDILPRPVSPSSGNPLGWHATEGVSRETREWSNPPSRRGGVLKRKRTQSHDDVPGSDKEQLG
ncbi:hypothetical protein KCV07_g865, partial [Aureobasidium melanogenum]